MLNSKINPTFGVSSDLNMKYSAAAISNQQSKSRSGSGTSGTSGTSSSDGGISSYTGTESKSRPSIYRPAPSSKYEMPQDDSPPAIIDNYGDDFSPEVKKPTQKTTFGKTPDVNNIEFENYGHKSPEKKINLKP